MQMDKVLILTDGKAGHENQSKAFARALGCDFDLVEVHFKSGFAKALSYLYDHLGVRTLSLLKPFALPVGAASSPSREKDASPSVRRDGNASPAHAESYKAVLGTGSGTFYAAKVLAKKLGVKCGVVLYPRGYAIGSFDCILAPAFDNPAKAPNVIEIPANLVANDEAFYEKGTEAFAAHYAKANGRELVRPDNAFAVIVGGPNTCSTLSVAWMKEQLDKLFALGGAESDPSANRTISYWITTSRRTPPEVEALVDTYPWDYKLLYSKDHFNPIPAFVKLARRLYVTAESTGMLSEACTCGSAEVYALDNLKPGPHKFRRFVENLRAGGYVEGNRKVNLSAEILSARDLLDL